MTLANALESYEAQVLLLARWLRQGGLLGACENIYARYVALFFSSSRRPSVPNHVWWKFLLRCMCMYRRAHTRIMFRCWILHLPLSTLATTISVLLHFSFIGLWFVSFYVE